VGEKEAEGEIEGEAEDKRQRGRGRGVGNKADGHVLGVQKGSKRKWVRQGEAEGRRERGAHSLWDASTAHCWTSTCVYLRLAP